MLRVNDLQEVAYLDTKGVSIDGSQAPAREAAESQA